MIEITIIFFGNLAGTLGRIEQMDIDTIEQLSKIISIVAIPIVVAIVGWYIQNSLAKRNVSQEYVKLAVSILKESKEKTDPALRDWAVDLLNENSPTKFSRVVAEKLKAGQANLPTHLAAILSSEGGGGSLAISPDGKTIASGHTDGTAKIWDLLTGKELSVLIGHTAPVTAVAFLPDAKHLVTGSLDKTAKLWDLNTGKLILSLHGHTDGIIGVTVSPDGRVVLTRSLDGTMRNWDIETGMEISRISVPE
jgi:WD40 repeat protein